MKILMNARFFHRSVEMEERKLFNQNDDYRYNIDFFFVRCVNEIGSYRCYCTSGWVGSTCAKAIDYCLSQPCNRN